MRIAVDVMGGDYAPSEIIQGALMAVMDYGIAVTLVGDESRIREEIPARKDHRLINIVHAPEVVDMGEHPAVAVRRKKNASIVRTTQLVKEGSADALVSAGSTGAAMSAALLGLGRIPGIDRPAIIGVLPNENGFTVLLDVGANVDCKPHNLLQFGVMGYLYAKKILGKTNPLVGLLSIGEEAIKGNEATLSAYPLLAGAGINFVGNVEGRDIFSGSVDVVICDGFVGNIVLKAGEGIAGVIFKMMKEEIGRSWFAKMGTVLAEPAFKGFQKRIDYAEYGGFPLLGVNGVVIVCHGSSTAKAIKNAIRVAAESVENRLVEGIRNSIKSVHEKGAGVSIAHGTD